MLFYGPESIPSASSAFSMFSKELKKKWEHYRNKKRGYQLTSTEEQ